MFDLKLLFLLVILCIAFIVIIAMSVISEDDSSEWKFETYCGVHEKTKSDIKSDKYKEIRNWRENSYDPSSKTYCISYEFRDLDNPISNHNDDNNYINGTHKDYDCEFLENEKICTLKKQQTLWFFAYAQSGCNVNDEQRLNNLAMGLTACGDKIEHADPDIFATQKMNIITGIIIGFFLIAFAILGLLVMRSKSNKNNLKSDIAGNCGNCDMPVSFTASYCVSCGHRLSINLPGILLANYGIYYPFFWVLSVA